MLFLDSFGPIFVSSYWLLIAFEGRMASMAVNRNTSHQVKGFMKPQFEASKEK